MKYSTLAILVVATSTTAQGIPGKISPKEPAPEGCKPSFDGAFEVTVVNVIQTAKRDAIEVSRTGRDR
jgi:hypothetical protein